jgi:hypothetical protein
VRVDDEASRIRRAGCGWGVSITLPLARSPRNAPATCLALASASGRMAPMSPRLGVSLGGMICLLLFLHLQGCSTCGRSDEPGPQPQPASPAPAPEPPPPEPAPERRILAPRSEQKAEDLLADRDRLLEAHQATKRARAAGDAERARELLASALESAPLAASLQVLEGQAALAAKDATGAHRAARIATHGSEGRDDLDTEARWILDAALEAMQATASDAGSVTEARGATVFTAGDLDSACEAIRAHVSESVGGVFECAMDALLDLEAPPLLRAAAFRVDLGKSPSERQLYVALERAEEVTILGPVASVFSHDAKGLVNDVIVDLQRIDVLRGGTPEIVVKLSERRTVPDPVLNEVLELDRTTVVLLTLDRGHLEASRPLRLEESIVRRAIDPKARKVPTGHRPLRTLGVPSAFRMKVAWSRPGEITLSKISGNADPPDEGAIELFPTKVE